VRRSIEFAARAQQRYLACCTAARLEVEMRGIKLIIAGLCLFVVPTIPASAENDYPTAVVVDYVLGCMRANGQSREALDRCSCSFDVMASIISYDRYVNAETAVRMGFMSGERGSLFRDNPATNAMIQDLKRAQAEAELQCF
jgi:hypothetical protein